MSPENNHLTREEFLSLPPDYFRSIDKRIVGYDKIVFDSSPTNSRHEYRLRAEVGKRTFNLFVGLGQNPEKGERFTIWYEVDSLKNSPRLTEQYQEISDWWQQTYPKSIFGIAINPRRRELLVGYAVSIKSISSDSAKTLIAKLLDIIPVVEAKAQEISTS